MLKVEDYIEHYNKYFKEFHRLAVGEYADLSYGNDQPNPTASSLESIIAYANYIGEGYEGFILNAGSGAASWVFRKIFKNVICVDPNVRFQKFIGDVLFPANNISTRGFCFSFTVYPNVWNIDHCYYDYGSIERLPYLGKAIDLAAKSIYVDDTDCRDECMPYRKHVIALCEAMGLKVGDCLDAKDSHGRWGLIIEK